MRREISQRDKQQVTKYYKVTLPPSLINYAEYLAVLGTTLQ